MFKFLSVIVTSVALAFSIDAYAHGGRTNSKQHKEEDITEPTIARTVVGVTLNAGVGTHYDSGFSVTLTGGPQIQIPLGSIQNALSVRPSIGLDLTPDDSENVRYQSSEYGCRDMENGQFTESENCGTSLIPHPMARLAAFYVRQGQDNRSSAFMVGTGVEVLSGFTPYVGIGAQLGIVECLLESTLDSFRFVCGLSL